MKLARREFLKLGAAAASTLAAPGIVQAQGTRVLKFMPQSDLSQLDPIMTTAGSIQVHANMVFDTLYGWDETYRAQPQMVEGHVVESDGKVWKMTLRDGLKFHDGTPVLARDVVASLKRWGKRDPYGITVLSVTDELSAPSDKVVQFRLKKPFPHLPDALGKFGGSIAVIMPERLASLSADAPVPEVVGSGPFRYVAAERVPGSRNVYRKFEGYVPRPTGTPSLMSGPKIAYMDRVEWHTIPDAATAAAALQSGEMDWWDQALPDLVPLLARDRNIMLDVLDPAGFVGIMRPNHLTPPFNNPKVRRALWGAINQIDFMTAAAGNDARLRTDGVGYLLPESPFASDTGMDLLKSPRNLDKVKRDLAEAGYNGEKVVYLAGTDFASINAMSEIAGDMFRKLGMNLDYQSLDWGTVTQRRNSKEPLEKGGWSAYCGYTFGVSTVTPATNIFVRANGPAALGGWPDDAKLEQLRSDWLDESDAEKQKALCRQFQAQAFDVVPYYPLGRFRQMTAYRRTLTGMLKGQTFFYNVKKA